ncbi:MULTISPECIES: hypothetical protein [unclassified Roseovarius]|uniref:hypothetical protein n=1 Tax=unclassified Roseovarius TaxID=2614913 RepID=UPI00273FD530|nr:MULTISPECIES: hypothetical protein [unclassified Roseovarius]
MNHYSINRNWSDQFLPQIKRIVGSHLLETSPDPLDWHQATDLLMLDARDMRIAARVRRPGYATQYPHQFTIRSRVASGAETELSKIVNGKGDWLFYGHANAAQTAIESWYLIDLRAFRAGLIRQGSDGLVWGNKTNADGTRFTWFDIRSFPEEPRLVVARSSNTGT